MTAAVDGQRGEQALGLVALSELAESSRLARRGRYAEADAALATARRTPAGLDLRARMAAQQGRLDDATELWEAAAGQLGDPDAFAAERAAVALARRRRAVPLRWAALGGLVAVSGVAVVAWLADGESSDRADEASIEALQGQAAQLDRIEAQLGVDDDGLDALEARLGEVEGVAISPAGDLLIVRFSDPVFVLGTTLSPAGTAGLDRVGAALVQEDEVLTVTVTGHVDGVPLPAGSRWGDDDGLAVARAQVAADRLVAAGLPADRVVLGPRQGPSPYHEAAGTEQPDRRNRTVTLAIQRA